MLVECIMNLYLEASHSSPEFLTFRFPHHDFDGNHQKSYSVSNALF
jgi:hypothetical protein